MIAILSGLASAVTLMWVLALAFAHITQLLHIIKGGDRLWRAFARVHQELWIVAPIGLLTWITHHSADQNYVSLFFDLLNAWNWWRYRNWPDDNHWKRRAKKAKDAVKVVAGRLVVVPQTGGAS